jgi:hypothetical protein
MQPSFQQATFPIGTVLVPQGAEYQAVQRGCRRAGAAITVVPLPMGATAAERLKQWLGQQSSPDHGGYLLVGLGGSLSPRLWVADGVLCQQVRSPGTGATYDLDGELNRWLRQRLPDLSVGTALGCDLIITQAQEKQALHQRYGADVVEMEGVEIAELLQQQGNPLAMIRIISDDCGHDLPDISSAIGPDGHLRPLVMATQFLRHPLGAARLIRGSLRALAALEATMATLFQPE